ncbi:MAG: aldo/keto reductase [Gemmatimonadetes bacterium]|nr:aldo/keto reductase [Gemmatimonadota bacterium]
MPTRALGRHGHAVSVLGLGGGHLARATQAEALRTIQDALDKGVTLFETGPQYGDGRAERWLGLALQGAARERATICLQQHAPLRDYKTAMAELETSLARLKTDRADIWMIHEVIYDNDPEWIYANGALDAALEARDQGKVRYIGFAGHKAPHILLKLLAKGHDWDVVAIPLNPLDAHFRSFERYVLPELVRRGVGVIGMKAFAGGALAQSRLARPDDVLRYALSLPVSSVLVGAESRTVLRKSLAVAREGRLFHAGDMDALRAKTRHVAGDGRLERYKTTIDADSTAGLLAHGYITGARHDR